MNGSQGGTMPVAARTDVGMRRSHNEDAVLVSGRVFAVADGVGGSAKGEVASSRAIETFAAVAPEVVEAASVDGARDHMVRAVLAANDAVHQAQLLDPDLYGMATTLTAAVVRDGGEVVVGHVGDSRLYLVSAAPGTPARQLTRDHSVVAELLRDGRIDEADVAQHPQRNTITRALGPEQFVEVDGFVVHTGPGDWLLACSDGLTEHVADAEMADIVRARAAASPDAAVEKLVGLANERGGTDNITVVIAQPVSSDVSGELRVESIAAAATTTIATETDGSSLDDAEGPAVSSAPGALDLRPTTADEQRSTLDRERRTRRLSLPQPVVAGAAIALALAAVAWLWSQSYVLVERDDGRVGIDRGFPVFGMTMQYRTSNVLADELSASDRERIVGDARIRSREDSEQLLEELPQRTESGGEVVGDDVDGAET